MRSKYTNPYGFIRLMTFCLYFFSCKSWSVSPDSETIFIAPYRKFITLNKTPQPLENMVTSNGFPPATNLIRVTYIFGYFPHRSASLPPRNHRVRSGTRRPTLDLVSFLRRHLLLLRQNMYALGFHCEKKKKYMC